MRTPRDNMGGGQGGFNDRGPPPGGRGERGSQVKKLMSCVTSFEINVIRVPAFHLESELKGRDEYLSILPVQIGGCASTDRQHQS